MLFIVAGQTECAATIVYAEQSGIARSVMHVMAGCAFNVAAEQQIGINGTAQSGGIAHREQARLLRPGDHLSGLCSTERRPS